MMRLSLLLTLFTLFHHNSWSFPFIMTNVKTVPSLKSQLTNNNSLDIVSKHNADCVVKIPCSYTNQELIDILTCINNRKIFKSIVMVDASNRVLDVPFPKSSLSTLKGSRSTTTTINTTYYSYSKATSMLQLQKSDNDVSDAPRYIPIIPGEEVGVITFFFCIIQKSKKYGFQFYTFLILSGSTSVERLVLLGHR